MEEEKIENADSQNSENEENLENESQENDSEEKTEDVEILRKKNQSLYAQLKKAKGFEQDEHGQWVKKTESRSYPKPQAKSDEFDYAQKAFLTANGLKGKDEHALALQYAKNTGKSLDDIVENKYFNNELNDLREKKATQNAMPNSSKRSNNSSQSDVDYWINKGELPSDVELRRKVVNERIRRETKINIFG